MKKDSNPVKVLITGAGQRIGQALALGLGQKGYHLALHYNQSADGVQKVVQALKDQTIKMACFQADFSQPEQAVGLIQQASQALGGIDVLINNAAIFENLDWQTTTLENWNRHMSINLTSPFFLSQGFAQQIPNGLEGRIINILDWRAMRPGSDHLPYTISKAGLAALTKSLAVALAPRILVNALALGAILPPADGAVNEKLLESVPVKRWAELDEVVEAVLFFMNAPAYLTGEILHLDGGRHLV